MKTRDTKEKYIKRAISLMHKAYKEALEKHERVAENPVVEDFYGHKIISLSLLNTCIWAKNNWAKNLRPNTWRQYRSSLKYLAELFLKSKKINEEQFNKINILLDNTKAANKKDLELRTSSKKSKTINVKDLKKIDNELKQSKNQWSGPTRLWIRAGILAGLRPSEWKESELIEDSNSLKLIVKNAKNTNGRSHGDKRTIDLSHLEENEISIIKQHLKVTLGMVSQEYWNEYYLGCSNLLRYLGKKIWKNKKRRPSLYTSRHQFSANSKASGCTPKELAALMGHASDLTAQMTYGKKVNGTRGRKPKANKAEMRNVKESNKLNKFSFDNY